MPLDIIMSMLYIPNFLDDKDYKELSKWLCTLEYSSGYRSNGLPIDRQQVWFHVDGAYFDTNWHHRYDRWKSHNYEDADILKRVQALVQSRLPIETKINSCLINKYKDGTCFIPKHKDSLRKFGPAPTIIGLSVGQKRTLRVTDVDGSVMDRELADNSLFIMTGQAVDHEILPDSSQGCRYSLTFRNHLDDL